MGIDNSLEVLNENLTDIANNLSDALIQSNFNNLGFLSNLPMVGLAFSTIGAVMSVRDILYLNNVLKFIDETKKTTQKDRERFIRGLQENPKKFKRLCINSVALLSSFEDERKATVLGLITKKRIEQKISTDDYLRLSYSITHIFVDDLKELNYFVFPQIPQPEHYSLISSGLLYEKGLNWNQKRGDDKYINHYELNKYGNILRHMLVDENFWFD